MNSLELPSGRHRPTCKGKPRPYSSQYTASKAYLDSKTYFSCTTFYSRSRQTRDVCFFDIGVRPSHNATGIFHSWNHLVRDVFLEPAPMACKPRWGPRSRTSYTGRTTRLPLVPFRKSTIMPGADSMFCVKYEN